MAKKLLVIGLDGTPPELLFGMGDRLPNISKLMEKSMWGPLKTCIPPVTNPAWQCMMSSKDPGELGVYGFRNRKSYASSLLGSGHRSDI